MSQVCRGFSGFAIYTCKNLLKTPHSGSRFVLQPHERVVTACLLAERHLSVQGMGHWGVSQNHRII